MAFPLHIPENVCYNSCSVNLTKFQVCKILFKHCPCVLPVLCKSIRNNTIVGTPKIVGPSKNWVTWGATKSIGGKGEYPWKGRGGWCRNGGWHFFITLQFICIYCVCVCGGGGEGVSFLYYILVLHSFELTVQDSHPSFHSIKTYHLCIFLSILIVYRECWLLYLN